MAIKDRFQILRTLDPKSNLIQNEHLIFHVE